MLKEVTGDYFKAHPNRFRPHLFQIIIIHKNSEHPHYINPNFKKQLNARSISNVTFAPTDFGRTIFNGKKYS
jgi:hypothetical protein